MKRISDLELNESSPQSQAPTAAVVVPEPANTHQLSTASTFFGAAPGNTEVFDSFAQQAPPSTQVSSSDNQVIFIYYASPSTLDLERLIRNGEQVLQLV